MNSVTKYELSEEVKYKLSEEAEAGSLWLHKVFI